MRDGRRRRAVTVVVATLVVGSALTAGAVADAGAEVTFGAPSDQLPAVAELEVPSDPVPLGSVATPLRFAAGPGVALELADGRRYLDTLELRLGDDQVLINDLTVDDYVAGVAEMPGRWPSEALKAQAVAARTYAWHVAASGTFAGRGYDICDTVDCQVFVGAAQQEDDEPGRRWRAAVDETTGQVLVTDDGAPILARYFSTSGGRTLPNEVVFPSSGPRPYLVGTDDAADEVSPFHRWRVTFTREEFETILSAGERLSTVVPIATVERLGEVDLPGADLRLTGTDGTEVVLDSVDFRRFVSQVAPDRFPDRFPTARADGLRPLPATLPSSRFEVAVGDDEVVVDGRGWGHAVGMGQYGALGRAQDGDDHTTILAAYYNGLEPTETDDLPQRFRVRLSSSTVGSVAGDGPFSITADGDEVVAGAVGTWQLAREGAQVALTAPPGWGEPAAASRTEPASRLPSPPGAVALEATTAVPGEARLTVTDADGSTVLERSLGAGDAGPRTTVWALDDDEGDPVPDGRYEVEIAVVAADGSRAGAPIVVALERPTGAFEVLAADGAGSRAAIVAVVLLLTVAAAALWRRAHGTTRLLHPRPAGAEGPKHRTRRFR